MQRSDIFLKPQRKKEKNKLKGEGLLLSREPVLVEKYKKQTFTEGREVGDGNFSSDLKEAPKCRPGEAGKDKGEKIEKEGKRLNITSQ